jgi:hypothetical protein
MLRILPLVLLVASAPAQDSPPVPQSRPAAAQPAGAGQAATVTVPAFPNKSCAIMGKPVSAKLFVDTEMGRIYMCCKACTKKILADVPKAHQTAYPVVKKAGNKVCPIMGGPIEKDSPTVVVQGYEVSVCCEDCIKEVQENAQVVLALVTDPKVVDVANKTCPVTEQPVAKNTFCLIGNQLVHLSSADCVEEAKKDPAKTLQRAQELRAREKKEEAGGRD